jgi:hypothetical protein
MTAHTPTPPNARYSGRWYFCWLIERRDGSQPRWLGEYTWVTDANEAIWYARKSDADAVCDHDLKGSSKVVVCEHGFDLGDSAPINSHDALIAENARLQQRCADMESASENRCLSQEHAHAMSVLTELGNENMRLTGERAALVAALEEIIGDTECYCADNTAANQPCGLCKASTLLKAAKETP